MQPKENLQTISAIFEFPVYQQVWFYTKLSCVLAPTKTFLEIKKIQCLQNRSVHSGFGQLKSVPLDFLHLYLGMFVFPFKYIAHK